MIYFQKQVDQLIALKEQQILMQEAVINSLREQLEHVKRRADQAVDQILSLKGQPPVTPPVKSDKPFVPWDPKMTVDKLTEEYSKIGDDAVELVEAKS